MKQRMSLKPSGSKLRDIFVHQNGHVKHLEMKLEKIKYGCELLSHVIVYATREIDKALVQGIMPPKLFHIWIKEAEEIENQANRVLKSDLKSASSSVEGERLSSMYNKIVDHLKKSPFELDRIYGRPVNIIVITPSSVTKAIAKYRFMGKTKIFDIHITKVEGKVTSSVESGISPAQEKQAEESMKAAQPTDKLHGKEADAMSTPFSSELLPIKDEMKSEIEEEMPLRESEKRTSNITWFKSALLPGSESASMSTLPEKLTSTEIAQTEVMPEQRNESKASDVGFKELTPDLSVQHEAEQKTKWDKIQVPVIELAELTSASRNKTEVEPKTIPLSTAETLPLEESEIASIFSETEGMSSSPTAETLVSTPFEIEVLPSILERGTKISTSQTEIEVKSELNIEPTIITSTKGRWTNLINLQILHGGYSTKMYNVIKDAGFGDLLLEEDDYLVFVRTNEIIEMSSKPKLVQGKISDGDGSSSGFLGRPKRTEILWEILPKDFILWKACKGLTEPPPEEKWGQPCVIALMGNEFFSLPEKPNCPNLEFLFLQNNRYLGTISDSFFDLMPSLQVLDLSRTGVRSLPLSLSKLTGLQALLLRDCNGLDELPTDIGKLEHVEVLDLLGTEVYNLPDEIAKLKHLMSLQVSFYGADDSSEYLNLLPDLVSSDVISQLHSLHTLSIVVHPLDSRWKNNAKAITRDVSTLSKLTYLQFYFPEVELLELFVQKSQSWKEERLGKFKFVIGQDIKRIVSRVPDNIESEYGEHDRCLRFVNGDGKLKEVVGVLERVTAFYLDHHYKIENLSEFGITNFKGLKFCVVRECPKIVEIIDSEERTDSVLPCLEHLSMHYLPRLENIWKSLVPQGSLVRLKFLSVHTCPKLEFVLKWSMLNFLSNLEELVVEDCFSVKVIIEMEGQSVNNGAILPRLKKMELRYLPQLESILNGPDEVWPGSELRSLVSLKFLSVHTCPKLEFFLQWSILNLLSNLEELVVEDCFSVKVRIEMEAIVPHLKKMELRCLPQLESILNGPDGVWPTSVLISLDSLKFLSVHTCPKLKFILKWSMLNFLSNLEELVVEDCFSVKVIIEMEGQSVNNGAILPRLKKMELRYLPQLESIWNGPNEVWPRSKLIISVYGCPKLKTTTEEIEEEQKSIPAMLKTTTKTKKTKTKTKKTTTETKEIEEQKSIPAMLKTTTETKEIEEWENIYAKVVEGIRPRKLKKNRRVFLPWTWKLRGRSECCWHSDFVDGSTKLQK